MKVVLLEVITTVDGLRDELVLVKVAGIPVEFTSVEELVRPDVHTGGMGMSETVVKLPEMVGCEVPDDVGEVISDEFHVDQGVSTGCVNDGGAVVFESKSVERGLEGVVGEVPAPVDADELTTVNGGTRVTDAELGVGVREMAVPVCAVDERELADGIAGSIVELAV